MPPTARADERARTRRLIRGAGLIAAAAVILLIVAGMGAAYRYWDSAERRQQLVVQTYEVLDVGRQLLSTLQDAETGQRGYLLTGKQAYLAPYDEARLHLKSLLSQLEGLAGDVPEQARRVRTVRMLAITKMEELNNSLVIFRMNGREAAAATVENDLGQNAMIAIRTEMTTFFSEQQAVLGRRLEALRNDQEQTIVVAALTFGGSLAGLVVALVLCFLGVRQLSATERELAARSQLLQSTLENLPDAIVVLDPKGSVVAWNEIFSRTIGWQPTKRLYPPRSDELAKRYPAARALLGSVLSADRAKLSAGSQDERVTLDGREYEIAVSRMPEGEIVVACLDVTDRLTADAVLRHGQKMEAIGQLTGGIAHDFNNILQVIQTNLDLLGDDVAGNTSAAARVQSAQASAQRAARLTRQLLAFARRQPLAPVPIDVGRLVLEMSDLLHHSLGEKIEVACIVADGSWNAKIDASQLENAIVNLAINARDAMPNGGKLTVEVSNLAFDSVAADRNDDRESGEYVVVAVTDIGTGMPPTVVEKAFDPFFTTKEEGKGSGLGLSMVYGFIKQSGGHVKIDSEVGKGTAVKMYLPRTLDVIAATPPTKSAELPGSERILVVEDNDDVRRSVVEMLTGLGYRITSTSRPDLAVARLRADPFYDLLLTDVVMPGELSAVDLAAVARQLHPGIAIVFMSGYTQSAAMHQYELLPGTTLLGKPFRRQDLAERLRAALAASAENQKGSLATVPPRPASPHPASNRRDAMRLDKRVLLVEDEALVRMATVDSLRRLGCTVEATGAAEQALEMLRQGPFDLLITDIGLPGMSGWDLADEARRLHPEMPIAITSGYRDRRSDALPANTTYLVKPYSMLDLRPLLARTKVGND